ncbi:hypothetical protein FACS189492_1250 [Clostridia bacterium]|nr:hypothetical protein FACS189492_1250 [Clostridia bacterium]
MSLASNNFQDGDTKYHYVSYRGGSGQSEWLLLQVIVTAGDLSIPAGLDVRAGVYADNILTVPLEFQTTKEKNPGESFTFKIGFSAGEYAAVKNKSIGIKIEIDGQTLSYNDGYTSRITAATGNWVSQAADGFASGDGNANGPYIIETAEQLAYLAATVNAGNDYMGKYITLATGIDLGGKLWTPIGASGAVAFAGIFNGGGFGIANLTAYAATAPQGLFGVVSGGQVSGVRLENVYISGGQYAGAVAGVNSGGAITDCYADGVVVGSYYVGGIAGVNLGTISQSTSNAAIVGYELAGGIAGMIGNAAEISGCVFTNCVASVSNIGGIVGAVSGGTAIADCTLTGTVEGNGGAVVGNVVAPITFENITYSIADINKPFCGSIADGVTPTFVNCSYTTNGGIVSVTDNTSALALQLPSNDNKEPILIGSASELQAIAAAVNAGNTYEKQTIKLTADIDLADIEWVPIGNETYNFAGNFYGDNYTISNLIVNEPNAGYIGLFGCASVGMLTNIIITDCNVIGNNKVGALAGYSDSFIFGCSVSGTVTGAECIGGLVGFNNGKIAYSNSSCTVEGQNYIGGFIGRNYSFPEIIDCYSAGDVVGDDNIGGFTGTNDDGPIINCYAIGNATANGEEIGGFIGKAYDRSVLDNCGYVNEITTSNLTKTAISDDLTRLRKINAAELKTIMKRIGSLHTIAEYESKPYQTSMSKIMSNSLLTVSSLGISSLPGYTFSTEVTVANPTASPKSYMSFIAAYSKTNDRLHQVFTQQATVAANGTQNITATADLSSLTNSSDYYLKAFVWETTPIYDDANTETKKERNKVLAEIEWLQHQPCVSVISKQRRTCFHSLLAECLCYALDGCFETANAHLKRTEQYLNDRKIETFRKWQLVSCFSLVSVFAVVVLAINNYTVSDVFSYWSTYMLFGAIGTTLSLIINSGVRTYNCESGKLLNFLEVLSRLLASLLSCVVIILLLDLNIIFTALKENHSGETLRLLCVMAGFSERLIPSILQKMENNEIEEDEK